MSLARLLCHGMVALVLAVTGATAAHADLHTNDVAFKAGDFTTAFKGYKELAELGQPTAQFNLAAMYARGDGVDLSNTYAHAWASLAGANGVERGTRLAAELEPELSPTSLQISQDLQRKYSASALDARLLPKILNGREYADRDSVRLSKPFMPDYPAAARMRGIQGEAFVELTVAPDGHPRMPRILYAVPTGYFEEAIQESILRAVYLPARVKGIPVATATAIFFNFKMEGVKLDDYGSLEHTVENTKKKAEAGDPGAQMLYGMMIAGLPQLQKRRSDALPWFLKAAQAGAPYAQYQIGTSLLLGRGCECDATKGEIWLEKAAQADEPNAQVSLAEYLLRDNTKPDAAGAVVWLERAAKQNNATGKLLLSAILAASPVAEVRDPNRAATLAASIEKQFKIDPSYWDILAAAKAAKQDYKGAVAAEERALSQATKLEWDTTAMKERKALYSSAKPYVGNLLSF